ncbi:hypothetical protein [Dokdonella soli]|uniref:Uncharacterized protein n=1 Tax=Dokdonella soli TaxID=529810 RepID=A0ABN1IQF4_9GAMM
MRSGLKLVATARAYAKLRDLRGKVRLSAGGSKTPHGVSEFAAKRRYSNMPAPGF